MWLPKGHAQYYEIHTAILAANSRVIIGLYYTLYTLLCICTTNLDIDYDMLHPSYNN